ncbi:MAG: putative collagen-binding domain-containing protein [Thermodesulfobacteriota bacterium]
MLKILKIKSKCFIILLSLVLPLYLFADEPLPGQIIVDPENPQWLKYAGAGPFFLCGPGDPEDFLYRGSRISDGTRSGDQMELINKLAQSGANSIYLQAVRSHGGDGNKTHNPFIDSEPSRGVSTKILEQWEVWFDEMERDGIVIFFFFYDDDAKIWNTGDRVDSAEREFIETIVNYFEHHKHLIWVVAEEYQEEFSARRVSNIASAIRAADDYDHVIGVHKLNGLDFSEFANDPNIDQFVMQYNKTSIRELNRGMAEAWEDAKNKYNLNMAEAADHGTGKTMRQKNWACAMGGTYVMVLGMDIKNSSTSDLKMCGYLHEFMEQRKFYEMSPHNDLVSNSNVNFCLAKPGEEYIVYLSNGGGVTVDLSAASGQAKVQWFDPGTGKYSEISNVAAQQRTDFDSPFAEDAVLLIRTNETDTTAPSAPKDLTVSPQTKGF